jgi:cold shock CspA family protein
VRKFLGYVQWFDSSKGEGMIYCPEKKESYYVHWSAIELSQECFFKLCRNLRKLAVVEFTVYENIYSKQIDSIWNIDFDWSVENEWKINRLMNELFEESSGVVLDIANHYYGTK